MKTYTFGYHSKEYKDSYQKDYENTIFRYDDIYVCGFVIWTNKADPFSTICITINVDFITPHGKFKERYDEKMEKYVEHYKLKQFLNKVN